MVICAYLIQNSSDERKGDEHYEAEFERKIEQRHVLLSNAGFPGIYMAGAFDCASSP